MFFRSLPSAIFLFASITNSQVRVSVNRDTLLTGLRTVEKANILPVIITNHTVTIAAELVSLVALCCISLDPGSKGEWIETGGAV